MTSLNYPETMAGISVLACTICEN